MTNLRHVEEALAGLADTELYALKLASDETPQVAPSLLAWIEGACDWELSRRCGFDYRLQPPAAAIDPWGQSERRGSVCYPRFLCRGDLAAGPLTFFDACLKLLTGDVGPKHSRVRDPRVK